MPPRSRQADRSELMTPFSLPALHGPRIMGILNVTPDSFSDGGAFLALDDAVRHGTAMADAGADIIDVGGESTRPPGADYGAGAARISVQEEIDRTAPVIERLHAERPEVAISIDTMKPDVARQALAAGATIVNDVSAGRFDEAIWSVAAGGAAYIAMHGYDPSQPITTDAACYADVVDEVFRFLEDRIDAARAAGIGHVIADVGIGFAKGAADNERLIREHARFLDLGAPLLIGASRKAFIGRALGGLPPGERLFGTLAAHAAAFLNGASIVRVHDVSAARQFFAVFNRLVAPVAEL